MKFKSAILCIITICFLIVRCASPEKSDQLSSSTEMTFCDSLAMKDFGADEYGMKKYILAYLKRGPNRDRSKEAADSLQNAHMQNIERMAKSGDLILAGPFFGDGEVRGLYIFNVDDLEKAKALTNTDPAIKAGSLEMELVEWYGPAALVAVLDIHKKYVEK